MTRALSEHYIVWSIEDAFSRMVDGADSVRGACCAWKRGSVTTGEGNATRDVTALLSMVRDVLKYADLFSKRARISIKKDTMVKERLQSQEKEATDEAEHTKVSTTLLTWLWMRQCLQARRSHNYLRYDARRVFLLLQYVGLSMNYYV